MTPAKLGGVAAAKLKQFALTTAPTMVALCLQFVAFLVIARGLGADQFGLYSGLQAFAAIGVEFVGLGSADVLVRAVAQEGRDFPTRLGTVLLTVAATLPVVVAGVFTAFTLLSSVAMPPLTALAFLVGDIGLGRVSASVELVMVAHGHTVRAGGIRLATALSRLAIALSYFTLARVSDLAGWSYATLLASMVTAAIFMAVTARLYGRPVLDFSASRWREGLGFMVNQVARAAQSSFDRLVLSTFADAETLGFYGAASRILATGSFPIQVVTRMTYPRYFVEGRGGSGATLRYAISCSGPLLFVGAMAGIAIAAVGAIASRLLGPGFAQTATIAAELALAMPIVALQYPPADALTGAGRQALRAKVYICAVVASACGMAVAARLFGLNGLIAAYIFGQAMLAASLWTAAFLVRTSVADDGAPANPGI